MILFKNIDDPETLETLAIREALALVDDLLYDRISVASDRKLAIDRSRKAHVHNMGPWYMKS